jgi:predicted lipoprotein with Yx(FWY)xxD motif
MRKIRSRGPLSLAAVSMAAAAMVAAGCGSSSGGSSAGSGSSPGGAASPAAGSASTVLNTAKIGGVQVVTNAKGFTLYWFVPDTSTKSNCNGSCSQFWPPVKGPATAGSGVTGKLGVITRSDGSKQATYDGHPLYTYVGDTAPGQAKGNGINLSGGVWHEMTASGATASGPSPNQSSSSGGYGY